MVDLGLGVPESAIFSFIRGLLFLSSTYTRPYLYPKQHEAFFSPERYVLTEATTKAGKAQPLDAIVYTPFGPTTMGKIKVGDYVLGLDGNITKVLGIFPQGQRQLYNVNFSDGTWVECDGEHLWEVHNSRYAPCIVSTKQLIEWPEWRRQRSYVPIMTGIAQFIPKEIELDPYLIGVLIGDGNLTNGVVRFASEDQEIVDSLRSMIPSGHNIKHIGRCDYHITAGDEANYLKAHGKHLVNKLDKLGLMGKFSYEKYIPKVYIYNTPEIRIALLQGIMDTDGSVNKYGQPIIEQTSFNLAEDIKELVQSLGGSVLTSIDESAGYWTDDDKYIQGRMRFRQVIRITDPEIIFRLERKKLKAQNSLKSSGRMFRVILPSRIAEAQCISIEDSRHLYLTNGYIPTHNTVGAVAWILEQAFAGPPNSNHWWVAPIFDQAMIAYTRIKNGLTPGSFQAIVSPSPKIILPNRAIISMKSGDNPDSLYGEDVFSAVGDEASRIKEESWFALRSTLTATQGKLRLIGNVKGRKNWFYRLARLAERDGPKINMRYVKITVLDAIAAGVIPQSEVEDAKRTLPERIFRELYMAEPSDDGGNPFGLQHIEACAGKLSKKPPVAFGVDLAKKHDYLVVIGLDNDGAVCVFERWQGVPWRDSIRKIHHIIGEDVPALVDSTGLGDPVLEELQVGYGNFKGYHFSNLSKQRLMEGLAVSIQGHEIEFPEGPIKIELDSFEYVVKPTGTFYSAPTGEESFDDCVCALALAREQWTTSAPAKNLMEFYVAQGQKAKENARKVRELDAEDLNDILAPTKGEVLTNELTELYNQTLRGYEPDAVTCKGCGYPVQGPERVTDGNFIWHTACSGFGLRAA